MNIFAAACRGMALGAQRTGKELGLEVVVAKEHAECSNYEDCELCPKFVDGQCNELIVCS